MERVESIEQYYDLIKQTKRKSKINFTNMYLMPDQIQRYIDLERIFYIVCDNGVLFILDEETYYKLCIYVDIETAFSLPVLEKTVLFRMIYRGGSEKKKYLVEKFLEKNCFVKEGTSQQVLGDIDNILETKRVLFKSVDLVTRMGYQIIEPDFSMLEEVGKVLRQYSFIRDYHEDFHTEEEVKSNIEQGGYQCIVDKEGRICAVAISWPQEDIAEGTGITVLEQYRKLGFASAICCARLTKLKEMGVKTLIGWVRTNNNESICYHNSMQFEFTDKYADEWILESVK